MLLCRVYMKNSIFIEGYTPFDCNVCMCYLFIYILLRTSLMNLNLHIINMIKKSVLLIVYCFEEQQVEICIHF